MRKNMAGIFMRVTLSSARLNQKNMKKFPLLAFFVSLIPLAAVAADLPQFKDFPVTEVYQGKNSPLNLTTPEARKFRTVLTESAQQKPDFAGHYIFAHWGCGSGCHQTAIIDAKNGRVFMVPFTITTVGEEEIDPVQFRPDSRLVVVNGSRNDQPENGSFYYLWDGKRLKLIQENPFR